MDQKALHMIVVIPTAGGRVDLLRRTLESLEQAHRSPAYCRTIVVENGPQRLVEATVQSFGPRLAAEYFYFPQANKSAALNAVLEQVGEELLLFLDDDVRLAPQVLEQYAAAGAKWGPGHFFGGPLSIDYADGEPRPWLRPFLPASVRGWEWNGEPMVKAALFLGANWAAFAGDLRQAGGFDPTRGPGAASGGTGQESTMQLRLLAHGARGCYLPEARVWHYVPRERCSPEWTVERAYRHGVSDGLSYRARGPILLGYPGGLWRAWFIEWARTCVAAASFYPRWRFNARWWRSRNRGVRAGWRERTAAGR